VSSGIEAQDGDVVTKTRLVPAEDGKTLPLAGPSATYTFKKQ
jgi:hypothetical protein